MIRLYLKIGILGIVLFLFANYIDAQNRYALIWGNSTYGTGWQDLPVVKNDVETMKDVFKSMDYHTVVLPNGNLEEMKKSLREFIKISKSADLVVFYYSGHAIKIDGRYYLIPAKTDFLSTEITLDYFLADDIYSSLKNPTRLFFFDACRDSYELSGQTKGVNPNISQPTGIGPLQQDDNDNNSLSVVPRGTMSCYATKDGKKAFTGDGKLSLFTQILSDHLYDEEEWLDVWFYITEEGKRQGQEPINSGIIRPGLYLNPKKIKKPTAQSSIVSKKISIKPDVPGAHIIIKGKNYDVGATFSWKIGETHTYTITAEGYDTYNGSVTVTESTPSTINITMNKTAPATLRVTSNKKAKVTFDDKDVGKTPVTINTLSGTHKLTLSANGYYGYNSKIKLDAGDNCQDISLTRKKPWFFGWESLFYHTPSQHFISYMYRPQYQFGIQYLYRFQDSHFLLGGNIAFSTGFFRGWKKNTQIEDSSEPLKDYSVVVIHDENGNPVVCSKTSTITYPCKYSNFIDPYNEAKSYNSNFMFLITGGYQPCNGLIFEIGVGLATHCKKIYMPYLYGIKETIITDMVTGEVFGDPEYSYRIVDPYYYWYKGPVKCSFATRLGMKFNIPVGDCLITLGGGYTCLFTNTEFSSWDVSIGFAFDANSGGNWW